MRINHNLMAINTNRQLGINGTNSQKSIEKLSSGLRINKAGDDAAGLAISEKMRAQIKGLDQASRNAQDGISMIQTAEGALQETQSILQRMRELANQAANDTNVGVDREEIQKEINQLTSEINRIGSTTEFNNQKVLMGTNVPAKTSDVAKAAITEGAAGVAAGATSALNTTANSVKAIASTTSVQASTSTATGAVKDFTITTNSTAGASGSVSLNNGIRFTTNSAADTLNGAQVKIVQSTGTSTAAAATRTGSGSSAVYTIEIGTDANGDSLFTGSTRGELFNYVKSLVDADTNTSTDLKLNEMDGSTTGEALTTIESSGSIAGGVDEVRGAYEFTLDNAFEEAGDTISFGGKTFKAVFGAADRTKGEFSIGTNAQTISGVNAQAADLLATITDASQLGDRFADNGSATNVISLQENTNKATGKDVTAPVVAGAGTEDKLKITDLSGQNLKTVEIVRSALDAAGATSQAAAIVTDLDLDAGGAGTALNGLTIKFNVTAAGASALTNSFDEKTKTLTISGDLSSTAATAETDMEAAIEAGLTAAGFDATQSNVNFTGAASATAVTAANLNGKSVAMSGGKTTTAADAMSIEESNGNLKIYLADTTASKNSAAKIEAAVQALGKVSTSDGVVDFSKYKFEGQGSWDSSTIGNSITKGTGTLVGGTKEVKGSYNFDVATAFAEGDIVEIGGQSFKAVASGAKVSEGEFNVAGGDINAQAASIRDALSLNTALKDKYDIGGSGSNITLNEKVGSGTDLKAASLDVRATGTKGEYSVAIDSVMKDGGSFAIDGEKIVVSDKANHVGYADGTAIKEAATTADQAKALADAINKNETLSAKYTASTNAGGELVLTQKEGKESSTAPDVKQTTSDKGDFKATLQVGANSGQSMTVTVSDMRSAALGVAGDGSETTVQAKDGKVAHYVAVANVTDGTNDENVEYALDVSDHEKASAAISVIKDAIENVSAQRSQLGAFQNRLEHTISNLDTSSENMVAAESRIRDVDMAKEMMNFQKNNILSQAAQAMLAQANQQTQGVLQLLR